MARPAKLDMEFGRSLPQDKYYEYQQRYRSVFFDQVHDLAAQLSEEMRKHQAAQAGSAADIPAMVNAAHPRDSWNAPLRVEPAPWGLANHVYLVRSAGPDGAFNSRDDLVAYIEARSGRLVDQLGSHGTMDIHVEHNRGPMNQRAEVSGTVVDASGRRGYRRDRSHSTRSPLRTHASRTPGPMANFLLPLFLRVAIEWKSFRRDSSTSASDFTLQERDRAILSATLDVASVTEAVVVEPEPPPMALRAGVSGRCARWHRGRRLKGSGRAEQQPYGKCEPCSARAGTLFARGAQDLTQEAAPHVRSYFPEALYINPEIITDAQGNADISIPVADSITTWRMAMLASTASGALGTATSSLKVFQDFFVDLDLPVTLTQGDQVSLPIAIYNYSGKPGQVSLKLKREDWFSLDHDTPEKSVAAESGRVGGSQFTLTASRIGKFKLTLSAHMDGGASRDDIVVREIEVIPNGREQDLVFNGRLEGSAEHDLHFPDKRHCRCQQHHGPPLPRTA